MSIQTILHRSISKATPLVSQFVGAPKTIHTSAAFYAVKRPTLPPHISRAAVYPSIRRFCSTAVVDTVNSDDKLPETVQSEIEVAEDQGKATATTSDFPFSIEDNPGEQEVTLTREYGGDIITVAVSMPNLVTREEGEVGDSNDDEGSRTDSSVTLLVTVTKKDGDGSSMQFKCSAFPDEIRINGLSVKNVEIDYQLAYEGPTFDALEEDLRKGFHKYLEIRGVKPSTTKFVLEYMIRKKATST